MKKKISDKIGFSIVLTLLSLWTAWPYWKASALATSRSGYLIWALSNSLVVLFLLIMVTIILWGFFQSNRTTILVIGIISILFGTALHFNAPEMLERVAPELHQNGTVKWLKTSIRAQEIPRRYNSYKPDYNRSRPIAAKVLLEDGTTVQALNISFLNNSGYMVEVHRDRGGTYWVGEIAEDRTRKTGGLYILMGLMLIILLPISRIGPVRKFLLRIKDN
jgi:hypothetical protein